MDSPHVQAALIHDRDRRAIAASGTMPQLIRYLRTELANERQAFEQGDATEYRRGRVCALRDLLRQFTTTGV